MPRLRTAEQAWSLLASAPSATNPSQQWLCHTCRQQHALLARRALHTTPRLLAEESFLTRIRNSLFGSAESKEASKQRDVARAKRVEELSKTPEAERLTTSTLVDTKGRKWDVAALVDESLDRGYVPAKSGKGLESIGGEAWVRERADGGEVYRGFAPAGKKFELNERQWKGLLHHVAVEVLALAQAGADVGRVCYQRQFGNGWRQTRQVEIAVEGGKVELRSKEEVKAKEVLSNVPETPQEAGVRTDIVLRKETEGAIGKEGTRIAQEDDAWLSMPLSDPVIKLAILKRTTQLTGHRPRDAAISSAHTLADLLAALKTREKPAKLANTKQLRALPAESPNVTVYGRRRTPVHQHKEVGRWKLITAELEQRDLPVLGSRLGKDAMTKSALGLEKTSQKKRRRQKKNV